MACGTEMGRGTSGEQIHVFLQREAWWVLEFKIVMGLLGSGAHPTIVTSLVRAAALVGLESVDDNCWSFLPLARSWYFIYWKR